jgi:uncharacterized protein (DUF2336 family)
MVPKNNSFDELRQLTWLAYQRNESSRKKLLQRITNIFLEGSGSYTDQQNAYFGDIMEQLASTLEWELRAELACKIANEIHAPRPLILKLANDIIAVARPILEQSPVLKEVDLIQLVRQRSQEYLLAITRRADIGVRLAAALIDYGENGVITSLLRNEDAEIASETLVHAAERAEGRDEEPDELLWSALIDRRDVPKTILLDIIENVSGRLKLKLLDRLTQQDQNNLEAAIETFKENIGNAKASQAELKIAALVRAGKLNQFALLRFAKESEGIEFLLGLTHIADIDVQEAWRILADKSGTALAIVCRAMNFSVKTFKAIAMSSVTKIPSDPSSVYSLVCVYDNLSRQNAKSAMSHWRATKAASRTRHPTTEPAVAAA